MATPSLLAKVKTKLVISEPFFATIALSLKVVYTTHLGGRELYLAATDGKNLFIHEERFNALSLAEAIALIKHEVMHVANMHNFRRGHRNPDTWNESCDYVVNDMIHREGGTLPQGGLLDAKYHGMSAEAVYNTLPPKPPSGGGSGDGDGEPKYANDVQDASDGSESGKAEAKAMITKAANVAKAMGKLPGGISQLLDEILDTRMDWRELLKQFMTDIAKTDYSFSRPNRRMMTQGYILPGRYGVGAMRKLGVVIDTSGSISDHELAQYFGELLGIVESTCPSSMVLVYCDAQVNATEVLDAPTADDLRPQRVGGGGTDLRHGLDWLTVEHPDCVAHVVLTDGYTPFPDGSDTPILWAMTTDVVAPVGTTIAIGD